MSQSQPHGAAAPLIEVCNLRFRYEDGTQALAGVDFALYPGESVALFGPNGSGKTTLLVHPALGFLNDRNGRVVVGCVW